MIWYTPRGSVKVESATDPPYNVHFGAILVSTPAKLGGGYVDYF